MKILKVIFGLPGFAGDSPQMFSIIKNLQDLGHEVTIVTTDADIFFYDEEKSKKYSDIRKKLSKSTEKLIEVNGVMIYPVHCITPKMGMYCLGAGKFAKKIVKNYDVIHIYNWYHHLGMVFSKVAYEKGIPFIISAYGSLQEKARTIKIKKKLFADFLYTKKMIPHASALHSVGDLETIEYIKLGGDPKKIYRIDHGIDLENFQIKEHTAIFKKLGINENNQPYLLFIGRIDKKKGLDLLLHAFANLNNTIKNLILVIAGSGAKEYEKEVKKLVNKLKIKNSVKFAGFVTENEKLELLKYAKLFVLTSYSDVHPIAVQDSLAMGLPVLITKACDYPEVAEYKAGIIVDENIDSVYEGLIKVLADEDQLRIFSENTKKLIKEKFLLKNIIKKYELMYFEALKNS